MENSGVPEESGVMQEDPFVAKAKVTEKAGAMEKSEKMVENSSVVAEQQTAAVHVCEVCGTYFETRRGLSSHARSHLRQLGVCVSESSGAPISLLYELITERDGALPFTHKHTYTHSNTTKHATHSQHRVKHTVKHGIKHTVKHGIKHTVKHGIKQGIKHGFKHAVKRTIKHGSGTKLKIKIGELVKRPCVSVPAALRDSSFSSSSSASSFSSSSSSSSSPLHHHKPLKPPRTPPALEDSQKTDPSLELKEMSGVSQRDCVHVCELCGAWYETKKGLASHVRIHLHHYGVALEPKAPPIQVLHDLLQKKAGPLGQDTATAPLTPPPLKKSKLSPAKKKTPRDSDSSKIVNCEFCGENFKKTQSLASHARSHLRQLGVTDWTAHGSPMATLRELMARRSCSSLLQSTQTTPFTPPQANPMSEAMPTLATGPTFVQVPNPPSEAPPTLAPYATPVQVPNPPSEAPPTPAACAIPVRVPKAKKGWRMAVSKPKDEPVELDISTKHAPVKSPTYQSATDYTTAPANQNPQVEVGMAKPVKCDFCDDLFDSRKALSCHARGHLRQLGVKWAPCASPIDTLQQLMIREGRGQDSVVTPFPVDTCREKTETDGAACEATCELCGFDFENRKALASHARAHLRQQGEQWSSSQSPIAALSLWMNREPEKVAALHQLYMQGTLPQIRKRRACSPFRSSYADSARSGISRPSPAARQGKTGAGLVCSSSSQRKLLSHRPAPHSAVEHGSVRQSSKLFSFRREGAKSLKRVGNAPSLVPRPPETSLVKLVGKIYSLKCRFCEQVFSGPLSVQEDWLIHLRHHILNLKPDHARSPAPISPHSESAHLIGQAV